jgi:ABC-2 type transport system ATP-binding protein
VAVLDGQVEVRDGQRLVVRAADAAELNARLVAAGVPVLELAPERRGLEQVVLEATDGTGDVG